MIRQMLAYLRSLKNSAASATPGEYKTGYLNALDDIEEFLQDLDWEEGEPTE